MALVSVMSPVRKLQCAGSALYKAAYPFKTAGESNSGSNEIVSKCQFVGPLLDPSSFCCTCSKLLDIRGQKFGNGHRVKMNVIATAWPLNCDNATACPSWFVK